MRIAVDAMGGDDAPRQVVDGVAEVVNDGVDATFVDVGNPHCIVFVEDEQKVPVASHGAELEHHQAFPARTNVEFVAVRSHGLGMRVWERGVGETAACGTGACAAAVAAAHAGVIRLPVDVFLAGGTLHIDWDGEGEVLMTGPCQELVGGDSL